MGFFEEGLLKQSRWSLKKIFYPQLPPYPDQFDLFIDDNPIVESELFLSGSPSCFMEVIIALSSNGIVLDPTNVPGLVLWLNGDTLSYGNGGNINFWLDSSNSGNSVTQSLVGDQPTQQTVIFGSTHKVARFDGVDDVLLGTLQTSLTSCSVYVVMKEATTGSQIVAFSMGDGTAPTYWTGYMDDGGPGTLRNNLGAYWEFDETSGTRFDSTPNHVDLTDINNTGFSSSGIVNNAADFVRANGNSLKNNTKTLDFSGSWTIAGWLFPHTPVGFTSLVSREDSASVRDFRFYSYNSGNFGGFLSDSSGSIISSLNWVITPQFYDTWHWILYSSDGSTFSLYIDNVLVASASITGTMGNNASNFIFGSNFYLQSISLEDHLDGRLDEWGFWTRALTSADRDLLWNGGDGADREGGHLVITSDSVSDVWSANANDKIWHITTGIRTPFVQAGYIAGDFINVIASSGNMNNKIAVGSYVSSGTLPWNGDIAEVIVYDNAISVQDRYNVEKYLIGKYNGKLGTSVDLAAYYNVVGFTTDGTSYDSTTGFGLDSAPSPGGNTYSGTLLDADLPISWNNTGFIFASNNVLNAIYCNSQTISLPSGQYSFLYILGDAVDGFHSGTITITYSDSSNISFNQNFSDWANPSGFSNEEIVVTMPYRNKSPGGHDFIPFYIYGYAFNLDNTKYVQSVTLPSSNHIDVLSMTLVSDSWTLVNPLAPNIPGLLVWLSADTIGGADGDSISTWLDISGNGNNVTQPTSANQPHYCPGGMNGKPAVKFDGNQWMTGALAGRTQPETIFVVAVGFDNELGNNTFIDSGTVNRFRLFYSSTDAYVTIDSGVALTNPAVEVNEPFIAAIVYNGASSSFMINGVNVTGNAGGSFGDGLTIGTDGSQVSPLTGYIAEVLIYSGILTDLQIQEVTRYLNLKYEVEGTINPLLDGIAAYWKLNEASGTRFDKTSNHNDLTDNGGVSQGPGATATFQASAAFTSASTQYLSISPNPDISFAGTDFTFAGWVKYTANGCIVAKEQDSSTREFRCDISIGGGDIRWIIFDSSGSVIAQVNSPIIGGLDDAGTWFHLILYWDSVNGVAGIQINDGSPDESSPAAVSISNTSALLTFGAQFTSPQYFDGDLDEFGFWKRLLTSSEKARLFNNGLGLTYPF